MILVGLQLLVMGTTFFFVFRKAGGNDNEVVKDFVPFMPMWVAIFVPTIVSTQKKSKKLEKNKTWYVMLLALAIAVLMGMITMMLLT